MNKFKKIGVGVLIIGIVAVTVLFGSKDENPKADETIKIGVILPLSGQYAVFGESVQNAMKMSYADLENKNVELIFEDDEFDPKKALSAYNKLQSVDNVDIVIALASPSLEVLKPIVNKSDELMFTVGNENSIENDNVFEIIPWGAELFKVLGKEVSGKYKKVGVVYGSDIELFLTNKNLFVAGLGNQEYVEIPVASNSDTRTEVAKMLQEGVDSYTVYLTTDQSTKFMNEVVKQSGTKQPQLICDANIELTVGDLLGKVLDKTMFDGCLSTMIKDTSSKDFTETYKQLFNVEPNFLGVYGYDSIQVISKYFAGKDKKDWKSILESKKFEHTGKSGKVIFDNTGSRVLESEVHIFKNGKFVKFEN